MINNVLSLSHTTQRGRGNRKCVSLYRSAAVPANIKHTDPPADACKREEEERSEKMSDCERRMKMMLTFTLLMIPGKNLFMFSEEQTCLTSAHILTLSSDMNHESLCSVRSSELQCDGKYKRSRQHHMCL